jgi:hypothetical protein
LTLRPHDYPHCFPGSFVIVLFVVARWLGARSTLASCGRNRRMSAWRHSRLGPRVGSSCALAAAGMKMGLPGPAPSLAVRHAPPAAAHYQIPVYVCGEEIAKCKEASQFDHSGDNVSRPNVALHLGARSVIDGIRFRKPVSHQTRRWRGLCAKIAHSQSKQTFLSQTSASA